VELLSFSTRIPTTTNEFEDVSIPDDGNHQGMAYQKVMNKVPVILGHAILQAVLYATLASTQCT